MKILHIFTEERSAEKCFENLLRKFFPHQIFQIHPQGGRDELLKKLKTTIPSISKTSGSRILITIDQDFHDCKNLKKEIDKIINKKCSSPYKIRIICKKLESWFLGDLDAVAKAFSKFDPENYRNKADMRNVDKIVRPDEKLLKIIPEYFGKNFLPKIETSREISANFELNKNTSTSFQSTIKAIRTLIS